MAMMAEQCSFRASVGPEPGMTFEGRAEVPHGLDRYWLAAGDDEPPPTTDAEEPLISDEFAVTW